MLYSVNVRAKRDHYCKRAILYLWSSKILTPHPPLPLPAPASVYRLCCGGEDTLAGRRGGWGGGVSIFWKTKEIGLPSYSNNLSTR